MKENVLKKRIKSGEKLVGTYINTGDAAVGRIAGAAGYDFVWADLEHGCMPLDRLVGQVSAVHEGGTPLVVRVPQGDLTYTKKVLEMGVEGIIFPNVHSAEEADALVATTLYPPLGTRGFCPLGAVRYGLDPTDEYIAHNEELLCRFVQVEHVDMIKDLDRVMKNPYIDGFVLGPCDLSGSIGELGKFFEEHTMALIRESIARLKAAGKYVGLLTGDMNPDVIRRWSELGVDMISAASDYGILVDGFVRNRRNLERIHKGTGWSENKVFGTVYNNGDLPGDAESALAPAIIYGKEALCSDVFGPEKCLWLAVPSVTKTSDGMLYCTHMGNNVTGNEGPDCYDAIWRSGNEGIDWEPVAAIAHDEAVRTVEPIVWTDGKGVLWHFWGQAYKWWDGRGGVWASRAYNDDGGRLRWEKPRRLCDGIMATPPVTLSDGTIALCVSIWKNVKSNSLELPYLWESSVYMSHDGGESFVYAGGVEADDATHNENALVERRDGSLFMITRCKDRIAKSVSFDGGKSWTEPEKLMDHASARSYLTKFPSGTYLLVTNNDAHERVKMTAFISDDECETFVPALLLDDGAEAQVSYPAGTITADGRAYVAYDCGRYDKREIYLASFTERDLKAGKIVDKGSFLHRLAVKGGVQ